MASGNDKFVLSVVSGDDKFSVRSRVWEYMEKNDLVVFPRPCTNRIPNFKGAAEASDSVANLDVFKKAQTIKVHPDKPLEQARFKVLEARKRLIVPSPRLKNCLFNDVIPGQDVTKENLKACVNAKGVRDYGKPVALEDKLKVDLVVAGSVAVSPFGIRLGKGEGFGDLEFAMAASMGGVSQETVVVTIVHDCQVMNLPEELLEPDHDLPVDIIVTPTRVIHCPSRPKPKGIVWGKISRDKLRYISVLRAMRAIEREQNKDVELMAVDHGGAGDNDRRRREEAGRGGRGGMRRGRGPRNVERREDQEEEGAEQNEGEAERPRRRFRGPTHDVWVGAVPITLRVSDFKAKVRETCSPIRVRWFGRRGFAYLCFQEQDNANEALKLLDGGLEFDGKECVVQAATRRPRRPGGSSPRQRYDDEGSPQQEDRRRRRASDDEEYEEEEYHDRPSYRGGRGRGRGSFRGGFRGGRGRGRPRGARVFRPREYDDQPPKEEFREQTSRPSRPQRQRRERRRRPLRPALKVMGLPETLRVRTFKEKVRATIKQTLVIWRKRGEAQLLFDTVEDAESAQQQLKGLQFDENVCSFQVIVPPQVNGATDLAEDMSKMKLENTQQ